MRRPVHDTMRDQDFMQQTAGGQQGICTGYGSDKTIGVHFSLESVRSEESVGGRGWG